MTLNADAVAFGTGECYMTFYDGLKAVPSVDCVQESVDEETHSGVYLLSFNRYSTMPMENNLFKHSGNPRLSDLYCNTSMVDHSTSVGAYCNIEDVPTENLPGY